MSQKASRSAKGQGSSSVTTTSWARARRARLSRLEDSNTRSHETSADKEPTKRSKRGRIVTLRQALLVGGDYDRLWHLTPHLFSRIARRRTISLATPGTALSQVTW